MVIFFTIYFEKGRKTLSSGSVLVSFFSVFCIVMGCACQLVIKENDDDDNVISSTCRKAHRVAVQGMRR